MPTAISWTSETWNPTTGCDRVSPGCDHCYALTMAGRLKAMGQPAYQQDGDPRTSGPGFGLTVHPDRLDQPLRWRQPRRVFVNSMSDLFHPKVPDEFLAQVFAVMAVTRQHTYQVLTKRAPRMRALLSSPAFALAVGNALPELASLARGALPADAYDEAFLLIEDAVCAREPLPPLPNVWLGVSVEDQERDQRVVDLVRTPAAVRFISAEPLLSHVDLGDWLWKLCPTCEGARSVPVPGGGAACPTCYIENTGGRGLVPSGLIHWLIVGGESGPGARPMNLRWAADLVDQAREAGVAVWVKQLGTVAARELGAAGKGEHLDDLPEDLRIREWPTVANGGQR